MDADASELASFFEAAVHTLLHARRVYPEELFERVGVAAPPIPPAARRGRLSWVWRPQVGLQVRRANMAVPASAS